MSNCAWMEWCADTRPGIATSEAANSALMLNRIFAPEKKDRRRILHRRQGGDKSAVAAHFISWRRRRRGSSIDAGSSKSARSEWVRLKPDPTAALLRLDEQADETRGAFGVRHAALRHQLGQELLARQTRRQLLWLEVGRDHHEGVVMRRARPRAGS